LVEFGHDEKQRIFLVNAECELDLDKATPLPVISIQKRATTKKIGLGQINEESNEKSEAPESMVSDQGSTSSNHSAAFGDTPTALKDALAFLGSPMTGGFETPLIGSVDHSWISHGSIHNSPQAQSEKGSLISSLQTSLYRIASLSSQQYRMPRDTSLPLLQDYRSTTQPLKKSKTVADRNRSHNSGKMPLSSVPDDLQLDKVINN
jgi:hypothetical protein